MHYDCEVRGLSSAKSIRAQRNTNSLHYVSSASFSQKFATKFKKAAQVQLLRTKFTIELSADVARENCVDATFCTELASLVEMASFK